MKIRVTVEMDPELVGRFYPVSPSLEQIVIDAVRYRFVRSRMGSEWSEIAGVNEELDEEIDKLINEGAR